MFEPCQLSDSQSGWIWEGIVCLQNLDLLVWWLEKFRNIPQMVVKNGDESHGIESVKKSPTQQIQADGLSKLSKYQVGSLCPCFPKMLVIFSGNL